MLQNNSASMRQNIAMSPGTYTISFWAAQRPNQDPSTALQAIKVKIGNQDLGTMTPASVHWAPYTTVPFTIDRQDSYTLRFDATVGNGSQDVTALIDMVTIDAAPPDPGFESTSVGAHNFAYSPGGGNWTFTEGAGIQSNGS